ncbi:hypothetical protein [Rhizobium sp. Root1204]|uniref:hypothetical protein n=1 Tax=Rhizobium sp. Root1204 TaxID=1736428 RepID=UPI0012E3816B|nr:hypothetical protein [Rhizobium sp. Root1204]
MAPALSFVFPDPELFYLKGAALYFLFTVALFFILNLPMPLSSNARAKILNHGIVHFTSPQNRQGIVTTEESGRNTVWVKPSCGTVANFPNFIWPGPAAFFFSHEPNALQRFVNLCGRHHVNRSARVVVAGEHIPAKCYTPIWDGSILIVGGYNGVGTFQESDEI